MKIEKIDDNSIRCTLTSLDLSSRNLSIRDMTYGSSAVRKLFREMIQIAEDELDFKSENVPISIEAIPLNGGSIQLIITKVDDPEELDTRFSKFAMDILGSNDFLQQLASQILEGAQGFIDQIKVEGANIEDDSKVIEIDADIEDEKSDDIRIFRFSDLDRVCEASRAISRIYNGMNTLYKDTGNILYYLVLHSEGAGVESLNRVANLLSEYAEKQSGDALSEAYFNEHFDVIVRDNAIQKLKKM